MSTTLFKLVFLSASDSAARFPIKSFKGQLLGTKGRAGASSRNTQRKQWPQINE